MTGTFVNFKTFELTELQEVQIMKNMFVVLCVFLGLQVKAAVNSNSTSIRQNKNIGVQIGFNNPYPSILGLTASYNLTDSSRISIGHSELKVTSGITFSNEGITTSEAKLTTYSVGYDHFFTDWSFRPGAGVHVANLDFSGDGSLAVQGFDKDMTMAYCKLGFDYQGDSGFQFSIGTNVAFTGKTGGSGYLSGGWFF